MLSGTIGVLAVFDWIPVISGRSLLAVIGAFAIIWRVGGKEVWEAKEVKQ